MLKSFLLGAALSVSLLFAYQPVQALELTTGLPQAGGSDGAGYNTEQEVPVLIGSIIKIVIGFLGVIFLLLTVYAGMTWMTAAGDSKKVDKAKGILTTAVIGLVIVLAAYTITEFVFGSLVESTNEIGA